MRSVTGWVNGTTVNPTPTPIHHLFELFIQDIEAVHDLHLLVLIRLSLFRGTALLPILAARA